MKSKLVSTLRRKRSLTGICVLGVCVSATISGYGQGIYAIHSQGITGVVVDGNLNRMLSPGTISIRKSLSPTTPMPIVDDIVTFGPTQAYLPAANKVLQRSYANGDYQIGNLPPGDYEVGMQVPDGYTVFYSLGSSHIAFTAFPFKPYGPIASKPVVVTVHLTPGTYASVNWKFVATPHPPMHIEPLPGELRDPDDDSPDDIAQVSQRLSCNIAGTKDPLVGTDFATLDGGTAVWAKIGVNHDIGGIGVNWTLINHASGDAALQIIDARSAGGAAWQSTLGLINAKEGTGVGTQYPIDHFNQAAGNSAENWGFGSPFRAGKIVGLRQLQYTPLFSNDHLSTVGAASTVGGDLLQSPCYHSGTRFGEGRLRLKPTYKDVSLPVGKEHVLTINSTYDFRAKGDHSWYSGLRTSADEQALYLLRSAAFANDLRIYVHTPGKPVAGPVKPADFFPRSIIPADEILAYGCTPADPTKSCFLETKPIDYAVLVWRIGKSDVAIAVHGENAAGGKIAATFTGAINLRANLGNCADPKSHTCGNVQWHTVFTLPADADGTGTIKDGQRIRQKIHYDVGTVAAITQMGYPITAR